MTELSDYEFPNCIHILSAGLHMKGVNPSNVTILMPAKVFWAFYSDMMVKYPFIRQFDGRGNEPRSFQYMGITFAAQMNNRASA